MKPVNQKNFAPSSTWEKLKDDPENKDQQSSLAQIVKEIHDEITDRNVESRREMVEAGRIMANMRAGKLMMQRDPVYGGIALIKPFPHKPRNDRHFFPMVQTNSSQLTSIWALSKPKAQARQFGSGTKNEIQLHSIEEVAQYYMKEIFNEHYEQQESLSCMDYGCYITRLSYDDRLNAIKSLKPIVENVNKTVFEGFQFCLKCGFEGTPDNFKGKNPVMPKCPECNSYQVSGAQDPQSIETLEIVDYEEIVQGDITGELLPFPACNWDQRELAQDSSYFQYRQYVPLRLVKSILGIEVDTGDDNDFGLQIIESLAGRGGSTEGLGRENFYGNPQDNTAQAIMYEDWIEPEWYTGTKLPKDEQTVSGEIIPKDTPLEEVFPDGMCAVGFSDMNLVAGIYNEKKRIISSVYHIQSFSGVGKGTQDAIEVGQQLNELHSQAMANLKRYGAGGGTYYDRTVLTRKEAQRLHKVGSLVPVNMQGTDYTNINHAIGQVVTNPPSEANLAYTAQLSNMLNMAFQTTEFTQGGLNDVDIDTLGGQQMAHALNQQRSAAPLRMKGFHRAEVAEEITDMFRTHIRIPKWFANSDKHSAVKGKEISGEDFPEQVRFDFVNDSEFPSNTFSKRQSAEQMLKSATGFGVPFVELIQINPRLASWFAGKFDTDIPIFNQNDIMVVCLQRLDDIKETAKQAEQMIQVSQAYNSVDPAMLTEQILQGLKRPVVMDEEAHRLKAEFLSALLDDDQVMEWSPVVSGAVQGLIHLHYKLDRDKQLREAMLAQEGQMMLQQQQMAAMAPMQAEQAAMAQAGQEQQMAQEAAMAEQERAQGAEDEIATRSLDQMEKDEDFARSEEQAENAHLRAMELKKLEQEGNKKLQQGDSKLREAEKKA